MKKSSYRIPLTFDSFSQEEKKAVNEVMDSGFYSMSKNVKKFEKKFAEWVGAKNAVMVNSGSSANLLLVYALLHRYKTNSLLREGDEVLVPALLWPTTVWPIKQFGLKPVLVDINIETLAIDLNAASIKITAKTKAIFLIHVLGFAADMNNITKFCKKHDLVLIEDCCESFGAFYNNKSVGTFGLGGTFSHFFSHHLTTIEGGSIVTNDDDLANDLRSFRAHGWIRDRTDYDEIIKDNKLFDSRWHFVLPGFNVRPTEIQGALGIVQLKKVSKFLKDREDFLIILQKYVTNIPWLRIIGDEQISKNTKNKRRHSWMNIPFIVETNAPISCKELILLFEKYRIETRPVITGNFLHHPAFKYLDVTDTFFPNTEYINNNGFMIGSFIKPNPKINLTLEKLFSHLKGL